jgi:hypothetical protein
MLSVDLNICNVVFEDGWDVDLGKCAFGENNQQTGLSAGTIAHDDKLATDLSHDGCCGSVR